LIELGVRKVTQTLGGMSRVRHWILGILLTSWDKPPVYTLQANIDSHHIHVNVICNSSRM
jgi:hypothetical protein